MTLWTLPLVLLLLLPHGVLSSSRNPLTLLRCKRLEDGCTPCTAGELDSPQCKDTGFSEVLDCVFQHTEVRNPHEYNVQVNLQIAIKSVSILNTTREGRTIARSCSRSLGEVGAGAGSGSARSTSRDRDADPQDARASVLRPEDENLGSLEKVMDRVERKRSADQRSGMSLLNFELIMLGLLGVSLPTVYWRKIRIRHL